MQRRATSGRASKFVARTREHRVDNINGYSTALSIWVSLSVLRASGYL